MNCKIKENMNKFLSETFALASEWKIVEAFQVDSNSLAILARGKDSKAIRILKASQYKFNEIVCGEITPKTFLLGLFGKENFITTYQVSVKSKHGLQNYHPFTTLHNITELVERDLESYDECAVQIIKSKQYLKKDKSKKDVKRHKITIQEG